MVFQQANQNLVLSRIGEVLSATEDCLVDQLLALIDDAERIFLAGAGRSRLVASFFAMRLMHCGYDANIVGDVVTPSIGHKDLLLIVSGSGQTEQLVAFARKAKRFDATIGLITSAEESEIGKHSDHRFLIGSPESYRNEKGMPMGTTFELSTLCFLEAMISHIIWEKDICETNMRKRHSNLE